MAALPVMKARLVVEPDINVTAGMLPPTGGLVNGSRYMVHAMSARTVREPRDSNKPRGRTRQLDMCNTCCHVVHMPAMIQIRHVPDPLHRRLKSLAALAGMSLSDYLLQEIREVAERPTLEELRTRLHSRPRMRPSVAPARVVRAERDRR
jgi:hypothetical protein